MTARELALDRALGMTIAALAVAMNGNDGCGVFCEECKRAIRTMVDEAKMIRSEGRK
jgi:hypothetical protein